MAGQRSIGRKGWGSRAMVDTDELVGVTTNDTTPDFLNEKLVVSGGLTKTVLNPGADEELQIGIDSGTLDTLVPANKLWVPAGAMTASAINPPTGFQNLQIAARSHGLDVWIFADAVNQEVHFPLGFKRTSLDTAAPGFKIFPVFFQDQDVADPGDNCSWEASITNFNFDSTLNISTQANEIEIVSPVQAQWVMSGGDTTSFENFIPITTINNDSLSSTLFNLPIFLIERHGERASDTYDDRVLLLGVYLEWTNDWSLVTVSPVVT